MEVQVLRSYVDMQQQTLAQSISHHPPPVALETSQGSVTMVSPLVQAHHAEHPLQIETLHPPIMQELEERMQKILKSSPISKTSRELLIDISENTRELMRSNRQLSPSYLQQKDFTNLNYANPRNQVQNTPTAHNERQHIVTSAKDVQVRFKDQEEKSSVSEERMEYEEQIDYGEGCSYDADFNSNSNKCSDNESEIQSLDGESELNACDLHASEGICQTIHSINF